MLSTVQFTANIDQRLRRPRTKCGADFEVDDFHGVEIQMISQARLRDPESRAASPSTIWNEPGCRTM